MKNISVVGIIKQNLVFIIILVFSLVLRLYRLDILTTFGGDQGQDFLVVRDMVLYHKWTLLGIKTSIAPFFQGPVYLYLLLPFFWIMRLDPIAGAYASVFMFMMSLLAIYYIANKLFNKNVAILSSLFFASSPEFFNYSITPLYQNLMPFFIVASIYLYLNSKKNNFYCLLLGLFTGLCVEFHLLGITLLIAYGALLILQKLNTVRRLLFYSLGIIIAVSPTILFELRHQFLNTHLFLDFLKSDSGAKASVSIISKVIDGFAMFLGANSVAVGIIVLLLSLLVLFQKSTKLQYDDLRRLAVALLIILFPLGLVMSSFEPHYLLPLWVVLIFLIPAWIDQIKQKKFATLVLLTVVIFNFANISSQLNNNHGHNMPSGWTLKKIKSIGKIIGADSKSHPNFNVASILDGNTRTYPVRYTTLHNGATPFEVDQYPQNDFLYLVARSDIQSVYNSTVWEVSSMRPFEIGRSWNLGDNVYLYRLERVTK